ncbi:hypothetical protein K1719_021449 [Acacia pycnantha]|nr:hypothetical protein K1719_021449 [Acacia pycnantha]
MAALYSTCCCSYSSVRSSPPPQSYPYSPSQSKLGNPHCLTFSSSASKRFLSAKGGRISNRLFYLSIPPNIFVDAVKCASTSVSFANGWTRVIVEKPFGRDSESSAALTKYLKQYLTEDQIFRIDHYLGKELVENTSHSSDVEGTLIIME